MWIAGMFPYWWAMLKVERKLPESKMYRVKEFTYGLVYQDLNDASSFREICEIEPVAKLPVTLGKDLPVLPAMETWVNIRDLGAKGDGETDDTEVLRKLSLCIKTSMCPRVGIA